jgi:uncharacterized RmlC-like cupin family protein
VTERTWDIVTLQVVLVPVQAPDQPTNLDPRETVAVRVTVVPEPNDAEQVDPQLIPVGDDVTVPDPVPVFDTLNKKDEGPKFAVTVRAWDMVTLQVVFVPVQAPDQPANREPELAVAVRVTTVPEPNAAEQVDPQLIPVGDDVTVPDPVPVFDTVSK